MNKLIWVTLALTIACALPARSQKIYLSLEKALESALGSNKELHLASLDEGSAQERYRQTNAVLLPQVRVSYTGMSTNNPLNAFGFKLQQQAITSGDFNPAMLNAPSSTQNFMTKVEWLQPVLNLEMSSVRQAAKAQQSVYAFLKVRTKEYIILEVQKAYVQLQMAHEARNVLEETLGTVNAIYTATDSRFQKGYLQKSDLLQVEIQVRTAESKLAEANSAIRNASDFLALLMGTPAGVIYTTDSLSRIPSNEYIAVTIPEDRADFKAMRSMIEAHEKAINSGKMSYLPKLNAFGEYIINDNEAVGFGSNSYLVGAQLSWTLFNGTATRHKILEQRIERDKTVVQFSLQREQAQLELNRTTRQLHDTEFMIHQQQTAVQQSAEALRIVRNRYQQGLVTTSEVLQAQSLLAQQKLLLVQSVCQHNTTISYERFLTATFEK